MTTINTPNLRLGTCSWSLREWIGTVYTTTQSSEFIREYAQKFNAVEIDSTFYGVPRKETLIGWRDRTPEGFQFAAKTPQVVTHEKFLRDCDRELFEFLEAMSLLGSRLGPVLLQFPYYSKAKKVTSTEFVDRLAKFLEPLPRSDFRFVVESRNKAWLGPPLFRMLKELNVPLALIDHPWMYPPEHLMKFNDILTGSFAYIRWLGDRYAIEKVTKTWNKTVVDRGPAIARWASAIKSILDRGLPVFGFVNSHYSGYAPADVERISEAVTRELQG